MLPNRKQAELRAAVYHITYEREALLRAAKQFGTTNRRFPLEAALVHARNLIDFFWSPTKDRKPHRDGVYAAHFYRSVANWREVRKGVSERPSQLYDALSAQVVHISTKRTQRDVVVSFSPDEVDRLTSDLEAVWRRFLDNLAGTQWRRRLQRRAARWRQAQ